MEAAARLRLAGTVTPQSLLRLGTGRSARVLAVRCLGIGALFAFEIALARSLGVAGYGAFSFALVLAVLASRLAPLGWLNTSTRLVSAYVSLGRAGLLKGSLILAYAASAAGLLLAVAILAAVVTWTGSGDGAGMLAYLLPMAVALALLELHRHVLRGLHAGDLGEALVILLLPAIAAGIVWGFAIGDVATAAFAYAATAFALVVLSGVSMARRLPAALWREKAEFQTRTWSLAAFALLLGSASSELATRTSVVLLGVLADEQDVALYYAAARLALMNVFFLRALTTVAAPRFSELHSAGRPAELRALFLRQCILSLAGGLPVFLVLTLFPHLVLGLFGPAFIAGDSALRILSIGYIVSAAAGPCGTALMMIGRERAYAVITFAAFAVGALANFVLIQMLGALGAAIATACVLVFNNALYLAVFLRATRPAQA